MLNESRCDLNDFLYGLFYWTVTKNVYPKGIPTELTENDTKDGFLVVKAGGISDMSAFRNQAYGSVRCFIEVYVPTISRGRYNKNKNRSLESAVNEVIDNEIANPSHSDYTIMQDSIVTLDDEEYGNGDNRFMMFIKSFIVTIDSDN